MAEKLGSVTLAERNENHPMGSIDGHRMEEEHES